MSSVGRAAADLMESDLPTETGCYVYGVVPASSGRFELPEGLSGIDDAPVEIVEHGPVGAVVAPVRVERPPGRRKDLFAHKAVLDACAAAGPVIPIRFGSLMSSPESVVEEILAPDEERLVAMLQQLDGKAQFNVRASYHESVALAEVVAADPEIARLRRLTRDQPEEATYAQRVRLGELVARGLEAKREADGFVILDAVLPHVTDHVIRDGNAVDHLLDMSVLVAESERPAFEDALEAVAEAMHESARVQLVGPMAPYDFVEE